MRLTRTALPWLLTSLSIAGCERCAPGQVGDGVARLSVRNVGAIADLVNDDDACGFASPAVRSQFTTEGATGAMGSATWIVEGCVLNPTGEGSSTQDCSGTIATIDGRAKVSARRTIIGTLTGNADQPVIPATPDAVSLELTRVEFDRFRVGASDSDARLTQISGSLSAKIEPRLAVSQSTGVCSIPTRNVHLSSIAYKDATVHVATSSHDFDVDVRDSSIDAVLGTYGERENSIRGSIDVWDHQVQLPDDGRGLDPDYDKKKLEASYACTPDLRLPVAYECGDIEHVLAEGAARLTIRSFGTLADLLEKDTACGFSSPGVLASARVNGAVGSTGEVTYTVSSCMLSFADNSAADIDCKGATTLVSGRVIASGTKTVRGKITGDPSQPIVPVDDMPAVVELTGVQLDNFKVTANGTSLIQVSGAISGRITPRVARDASLGACALKTPIARLDAVAYAPNTKLEIGTAQGTFQAMVDGSALHAVNGTWNTDSNVLEGTIDIGGASYALRANPMEGLDPMFDQASFDASWMCGTVDLAAPFDCGFERPIAQGTAQLTAQAFGALADLIERDANCGFSSPAVIAGAQTTGMLGDPGGSATFTIGQPCRLTFTARTTEKADCNGRTTYVQGTAVVTGTKTLTGYVSGDPNQPIVPTTRDPAAIAIRAELGDFKVWTSDSGNALTIKSGTLSGSAQPRTAIDTTTGACSIPTPVALLSGLRYENAVLEVTGMGKTFDVSVASSSLDAVNGSRDGVINALRGTIDVDGTRYEIPVSPGLGLDPSYDQATFDRSFACTPNLRIPAGDQDCNMQRVLAGGTARLLIQALGSIASLANSDVNCGFSAVLPLLNPSSVTGSDGQQGSMEWTIQGCDLPRQDRNAAAAPTSTDCLQRRGFDLGKATVSGMRHVDGLRQDINLLIATIHSITPNSPKSVKLHLDNVAFAEFNTYSLDPNQTAPPRSVTIHRGTMSALVEPITGEEANTPGKFDIATQVARMSNVAVRDAAVTIVYQGKTFNVHVDSAMLDAFNGSFAETGEKNLISGTISLGGQTYALDREALDPEFNQADFDARYACTANLKAPIPAAP
jgi:hypothetical protein